MPSHTERCCLRSLKEEQNELSVYKTQVSVDNEAGHERSLLAPSMRLLLLLRLLLLIKQTEEHFYKNMKLDLKL
jgi:hypothetical protein